jgi:hypothetical protein
MSNKGLVAVWLLFVLTAFCVSYIFIHVVVSAVMADFSEPTEQGYTTLEVKDNFGTQTDQYTPIQPAVTPIGKEF